MPKTGPRITLSIYDRSLRDLAKEEAKGRRIGLSQFIEEAIRAYARGAPEMAGLAETAEVLGVRKPNIGKLEQAGRIPERVQTLASGPLWVRADLVPFGRTLARERAEREARRAA